MQSYIIEELIKQIDIQRLQSLVVDVGASDGHYTSNSYDLIEIYGWHGILFEPQKDKLELAKRIHANKLDRIEFHSCAISEHDGNIILYGHRNDTDGLTTLNHGASLIKMSDSPAWCPVRSISYKTLVSIVDFSKVGMLSIDTEGYDYNILRGIFNSTNKRPDVIITERYHPFDSAQLALKMLLLEQDYNCIYNGIDQIFLRKDLVETCLKKNNVQKFKEWMWRGYCLDKQAFSKSAEQFFQKELQVDGWCAAPLMGILNFISSQCLKENEAYLEIGVYAGRSFIAALKGNDTHGYAIDNFWDSETLQAKFETNIKDFDIINRTGLYYGDSSKFDLELPKIGLLFYDANHDRGYTHFNLNHFEKYLSDEAIIIVDDVEIEAGEGHECFPGYEMKSNMPVLDDIIQWLREHPKSDLFMLTPWTFKQAIIHYRR